jgi:hypothetical protein
MVEFISVNGSLAPFMEVSRSVGFEADSLKKRWVEGAFELFSELHVGGVGFLCGGFDFKSSFPGK